MTFDMAQYGNTAYRSSAISEDDLLRSVYRQEIARPCLCGGVVTADPVDPAPGVVLHQETERHREWSARVYR